MYIKVNGKEIDAFHGRDIILFGCGSCGMRALEEFEKAGAHILGFCDNNPNLEGQTINHYVVMSPSSIKKFPNADIIITSTYEKEIIEQLKKMECTSYYTIKLGVLKETIAKEQFSNRIISPVEANRNIKEGLTSKQPYFIGRLGSVELECLSHYLYFLERTKSKEQPYPDNVKMMMKVNAGFFPANETAMDHFCSLYLQGLQDMDLIWSMWFSKYEDMIYQEYTKDKAIASYEESAFPLHLEGPWTKALEGKKVLVIHPFEQSIQHNYSLRSKLFHQSDFLPDFELITLKAVQSIAGSKTEYRDWFEALRAMEIKMEKLDFDVALIGAGAYGLMLGAYARMLGKKAVHIGGMLQLFFGIRGKAWDKLGIYNEYWSSPRNEERPQGYKQVEAGRYW